jgi:hypothetical protein
MAGMDGIKTPLCLNVKPAWVTLEGISITQQKTSLRTRIALILLGVLAVT